MRKLTVDEIDARVAMVTEKGCQVLLYKTARVDRAILDEEYTPMNWQSDFKVVNDNLYCGIGVWDESKSQWVWKWDCGAESNTEKEKGEASDAFKRAGFKWGIGVELYKTPFIWLNVDTVVNKNGRYELKDKYLRLSVSKIDYKDNYVSYVEIINEKTREVLYPANNRRLTIKKDDFEERFLKCYKWIKTKPYYSIDTEKSFFEIINEASKRGYDPEKCEEMLAIWEQVEGK